jgi:hypothetical protein
MRIAILFHFFNEQEPSAITVAEGEITDMLVPLLGDTVCHRDARGDRFRGAVVGRHFDYSLANDLEGGEIDGTITVTLSLSRLQMN